MQKNYSDDTLESKNLIMTLKEVIKGHRGKPIYTRIALSFFASNIFILTLNSSFAKSIDEEVIPQLKASNTTTSKILISFELRDIPNKSDGMEADRLNFGRNPFSNTTSGGESLTSSFLQKTDVSAAIFIGNERSALIRTSKGSDYYKKGEEIEDGYILKDITSNPVKVILSNGKLEKTFILEER